MVDMYGIHVTVAYTVLTNQVMFLLKLIEDFIYLNRVVNQGSAVIIKMPYVITYSAYVHGQLPKSIYQPSYLLPTDFPSNFS